jgi:hypothetical protein
MKVNFIGVSHRHGVSSKTNNSYSIALLAYAVPIEPKTTQSMTYVGHGYEVREIEIDPLSIVQFSDLHCGDDVCLILSPNPRNLQKTIVTGRTDV